MISRRDAIRFIDLSNGKFISLRFTKRTTGEVREMLCRTGVKKHLKGGDASYSFADKGLIPVFDMQNGYRSIPIEGITQLKIDGQWQDVV